MEHKIFDWTECERQHGQQEVMLYRELCNEKIDLDEFAFQYTEMRHDLGKKCPPSLAIFNYHNLKKKFGFFTGKKVF